jgi:hypothetical protein
VSPWWLDFGHVVPFPFLHSFTPSSSVCTLLIHCCVSGLLFLSPPPYLVPHLTLVSFFTQVFLLGRLALCVPYLQLTNSACLKGAIHSFTPSSSVYTLLIHCHVSGLLLCRLALCVPYLQLTHSACLKGFLLGRLAHCVSYLQLTYSACLKMPSNFAGNICWETAALERQFVPFCACFRLR